MNTKKMLELIELANKLSAEYGIYASVDFIGGGHMKTGINLSTATVIFSNGSTVTTAGILFKSFDENLTFIETFFNDVLKIATFKKELGYEI